jgi:hypothetical protein
MAGGNKVSDTEPIQANDFSLFLTCIITGIHHYFMLSGHQPQARSLIQVWPVVEGFPQLGFSLISPPGAHQPTLKEISDSGGFSIFTADQNLQPVNPAVQGLLPNVDAADMPILVIQPDDPNFAPGL